jgi:Zn-dependent protease
MIEIVILVTVIVFSVVLHELAHGYAANWLGDPTARLAGRLTLNPISHIDPVGSILLPGLLFAVNAPFLFGWAKPVPYNPYNLRNQRWGEAFVAAAGPLTNLLLAFIFALIARFAVPLELSPAFLDITETIILLNLVLAIFNAIPFPPLDGSKVLAAFLPYSMARSYAALGQAVERLGFVGLILILFIFVQFLSAPFTIFVYTVKELLVGA